VPLIAPVKTVLQPKSLRHASQRRKAYVVPNGLHLARKLLIAVRDSSVSQKWSTTVGKFLSQATAGLQCLHPCRTLLTKIAIRQMVKMARTRAPQRALLAMGLHRLIRKKVKAILKRTANQKIPVR
tara:strand:- start:179 stop:556 length:378 start_codon:yes stop_codon:yes gene_type:complete